jgi:hypothetical protein
MSSLNKYAYVRVLSLFLILSALTWTMVTRSSEAANVENLLQMSQQDDDQVSLAGHPFIFQVFHARSYFTGTGLYVDKGQSLVAGINGRAPPILFV